MEESVKAIPFVHRLSNLSSAKEGVCTAIIEATA